MRKNVPYRQHEFLRRQRVKVDGFKAWIVSAEDLLLSKLVWAESIRNAIKRCTQSYRVGSSIGLELPESLGN